MKDNDPQLLLTEPYKSMTQRSVATEVRKRRCVEPNCNRELRTADVEVKLGTRYTTHSPEQVIIFTRFACPFCQARKETTVVVEPAFVKEIAAKIRKDVGPITDDELIDLHLALSEMEDPLGWLRAPESPV